MKRLFLCSVALLCLAGWARAEDKVVKIGVLHSLSGTMAISETSLRDVVLMAVEEINAKGGVMGYKIQPVVVDPASNWPLFAEKAKQLIVQNKVAVTFGCWTSVSRKSCLPVFEAKYTTAENPYGGGLLFYPVQYEARSKATTSSTPAPVPMNS
ncbi:MAG TPA: transporter substrate-binding protein [Humisphaera sp.]|nr:transporter substrate-binding protein [Humisphaera sp.]